jgi:hypothetical protein
MIEAAGVSTSLRTFASFTVELDCVMEENPSAKIEMVAIEKSRYWNLVT